MISMRPAKPVDEVQVISALSRMMSMLTAEEKDRLAILIKNIKYLIENEPSLSVSTMAMASVSVARDHGLVDGLKKEIETFYSNGHTGQGTII